MADETRRARKRALLSRITPADVFASANWITTRDRQICLDIYKRRVLTIHQLSKLHFSQPRKARERLLELYERGVVRRFQPQRPRGSAPYHYVLGELGAYIVAGYLDLDIQKVKKRIVADQKLAHSANLPHTLETHDFFITLIGRCHEVEGHRLVRWWSEERCAIAWRWGDDSPPRPRPDAQGILRHPWGSCSFFLELDRGTERGGRLDAKIKDYDVPVRERRRLNSIAGTKTADVLLFLFPSENRELHARRHLLSFQHLCVATSHRAMHETDALGDNWMVVLEDWGTERLPLSNLPWWETSVRVLA
jgi:hypothetical protein